MASRLHHWTVRTASCLVLVPLAARAADVEPPAPRPRYSLPWQLRPVAPATVARVEVTHARFEQRAVAGDEDGATTGVLALGSYAVSRSLAVLARVGHVTTKVDGAPQGSAFVNPLVGALYGVSWSSWKLGAFLGATVPVGQGGGDRGDSDDARRYAAAGSGVLARSAMDNALFAVNYFTVAPGVGVAYLASGATVQVEATVLSLHRVRGDSISEPDGHRLNLTSGLHVGYFLAPPVSLGADVRYQRWLSTPRAVEADEALPEAQRRGVRDQASVAVGPRFHVELAPGTWFRPGLAYARGLDAPMAGAATGATGYHVVHLDLPVSF